MRSRVDNAWDRAHYFPTLVVEIGHRALAAMAAENYDLHRDSYWSQRIGRVPVTEASWREQVTLSSTGRWIMHPPRRRGAGPVIVRKATAADLRRMR